MLCLFMSENLVTSLISMKVYIHRQFIFLVYGSKTDYRKLHRYS